MARIWVSDKRPSDETYIWTEQRISSLRKLCEAIDDADTVTVRLCKTADAKELWHGLPDGGDEHVIFRDPEILAIVDRLQRSRGDRGFPSVGAVTIIAPPDAMDSPQEAIDFYTFVVKGVKEHGTDKFLEAMDEAEAE